MQLRTFLGAVVLALSLTSCSTVQKVVYRIDVPQGNYLEAATVAQVIALLPRLLCGPTQKPQPSNSAF